MWAGLVEKEELGRREARKAVPTRAEAAGRMRWCHDIGGEGGEGGSGEGKEWEINGGRVVSAVVKKPVQERGGPGLNKALVIVIGAEKETRCLVQRQNNEKEKWRTAQTRKKVVWQLKVGSWIRVRIMYEEVFLLAMNLPR